jgi:hypothetical protein
MHTSPRLLLVFALLAGPWALGCGDDGGSGNDGDDPGDGDAGDSSGDAGDDNDNGDPGDDNDDDGGDGGPDGFACKHLDIIFSIDPSGSMTEEMAAMGNEIFPRFADELLGISEGLDDYRVGTLDACPDPASFNTSGEGPTNDPGDDVACNFAGGATWIEATPDSDADAVKAEFQCVGTIDRVQILDGEDNVVDITAGECTGNNDDEQPTTAVITALSPPFSLNENAGFMREEAVLIVVAMSDEDEQPTPDQSAQELYDQLVAIKGDVKDMVFLGIGGGVPNGCLDTPGTYGTAEAADKLYELTNLFIAQERGVWWDLCQGELQDGLNEALTVIQQACDEFGGVD